MAETMTRSSAEISLTDEAFDTNKSNSYHLSIFTNGKKIEFAVLDTSSNKYLSLRTNAPVPENNFKSVSCSIAHTEFSLIPSPLFDEEKKESLFTFSREIKYDESIFINSLHTLNAKILFSISNTLTEKIRNQFPNASFIHSSAAFIEGLLAQYKNNSEKRVFANFYSGFFEIAILEGKELVFINSFTFSTPEEIAYYILFVYEQLNLNPETAELILSGEIEKTAKEHSLLYTYIRNVKFASRPEGFNYSYKFEEIPSHKFFSLFTQYLCA